MVLEPGELVGAVAQIHLDLHVPDQPRPRLARRLQVREPELAPLDDALEAAAHESARRAALRG
ncbi:MAG TPA: hypothetical protein VE727_05735 [Solirubrobacterales bacterium]|nr:hypothetical protein [Solirubrobacterales bacterium]